jgi:hypothetical protein
VSGPVVGRRQFLAAGAGGGALFAGFGEAAAVTGTAAVSTGDGAAGQGVAIVLRDPRLALPDDVATRLAANGARVITLQGDPVHFWRSEAAEELRRPGTRLYGLTRWADFLIFRGLAAETRRHVRYERLHPETDAFTWLIG